MITMNSAENAIKNIYLESVINDINQKTNPFLGLIEKNAKKAYRNEARALIRYGNKGNVIAGKEGGELPVGDKGKSAEIVTSLKNLYGTFQISDKAIKAAQNHPEDFAALISGEMSNLVASAQRSLNGMLYGNGMNFLGFTTAAIDANAKTFSVTDAYIENFEVGEEIIVLTADNVQVGGVLTVASIAGNVITFTGTYTTALTDDRLYIYKRLNDETTMNGVDSIFKQDKIYNLDRVAYSALRPYVHQASTAQKAMKEVDVLDFLAGYENQCEGMGADILLTHPQARRTIQNELRESRTNIDTNDFSAGFKGFKFNGLPVYCDVKCKAGTMYALNSKDWAMHQLCDWTWFSDDKSGVLKKLDSKAGYSASIIKYADLLCEKPFAQGKAVGYSAKKLS